MNFLNNHTDSPYICETIRLYLLSYGTDFDFCEFYLQLSDENNETEALIMRYNSQVYVLNRSRKEEELLAFLNGFEGCEIICDKTFESDFLKSETCYVMQKKGSTSNISTEKISIIDSPLEIANLVTQGYSLSKAEDFFLNTAYQMRHNLISVAGIYVEEKLASVVSFTDYSDEYSVITFVYTDEYFRGNGLSRNILLSVCQNDSKTYILLCEEHNIEFYKKCGFEQGELCYRFML